ncbi:hypothetical protein CNR22_01955 [Sphingobacteriaceae bacterium]|nr:hypothetical protein CNR22_01955 [Sphingobacteriaceae bacterium]
MTKKLFILGIALTFSSLIFTAKAQTASLQVIHNCADAAAGTVDIYAGTSLLINDLQFRYSSQTFTNIPAATVLTIGVAPGTSTASTQSIATFTVNFIPNSLNIVVADGIVSPTGYSPSNAMAPFMLSTYTAGVAAAPNATTTSILVHHGSTDAPTVDIVAPLTGVNPTLPNVLVNNASYPAFAPYLNLPTANYNIQVRDQFSENVVAEYVAPLSTLGLGGAALTVLASGFLNPATNSNGPAFGLYVATPAAGSLIPLPSSTITSTRLQAIHNCADAAATQVDVWFQSAATGTAPIVLINDFAFRTASPFIDVPAGQTVTVYIAPPTSTSVASALATFTYNLSSASKYQLIASGIVSGSGYTPGSSTAAFNLIANASVRERALNAINTDVLVFHGSTDAPAVNVAAEGAGTVVSNITYGSYNSTGYLPLASNTPSGNYTLYVTNTAGTATVATYLAPLNTLGLSGSAITVLASGFLTPANNSNGPSFGLWVALASGGTLIPLPALTTGTITGINEQVDLRSSVSVYPNPFADQITIKNSNLKTDVQLSDLSGKIIETQNSESGLLEFNTHNLNAGIYFLKVTSQGATLTYKIVK